jgi:hypothetical protein
VLSTDQLGRPQQQPLDDAEPEKMRAQRLSQTNRLL